MQPSTNQSKTTDTLSPHAVVTKPFVPRPWYREFWAWFILAPLIVVVIVSSFTISLAVIGADDRVVDNYYKEGRMINMRLDEDLAAARLQLTADIAFDQSIAELTVTLRTGKEGSVEELGVEKIFPDLLTLEFSHPSDQALDHQVQLKHIAQGQYQVELDRVLSYRWYLRLHPISQNVAASVDRSSVEDNKRWRLRGEIDFAQTSSARLAVKL